MRKKLRDMHHSEVGYWKAPSPPDMPDDDGYCWECMEDGDTCPCPTCPRCQDSREECRCGEVAYYEPDWETYA